MTDWKDEIKGMEPAKEFMEKNSYMSLDGDDGIRLDYSTRDHGDIIEGTHGLADVIHTKHLVPQLRTMGYHTNVEAVDEWIMLTISKDEEDV